MKSLFITYNGLTDFIGQSQVLPYISGLRERGHEFTVLSFESPERLAKLGVSVTQQMSKAGILWRPLRFSRNPPLLSKVIDQIRMMRAADSLLREGGYDVVHCRSYVAADIGLRMKHRYGVRFLFDMRGFWPDQRREGNRWPDSNPFFHQIYLRWKTKEKALIQNSDHIVTLAQAAAKEIQTWDCYSKAPISVIPCAVDFKDFDIKDEARRCSIRASLQIGAQQPLLVYLGSLGSVYLLDEMLSFFRQLKNRWADALFLFIGRHKTSELVARSKALGLEFAENDFRSVEAERADVPNWLAAADAGICFITPTYSSLGVSPTKLGEFLACGLPVVCNDRVGDVKEIVTSTNSGIVVENFEVQTLVQAAGLFDELRRLDRSRIRQAARSLLDLNAAIDTYDAIYQSLSKAEPRATFK